MVPIPISLPAVSITVPMGDNILADTANDAAALQPHSNLKTRRRMRRVNSQRKTGRVGQPQRWVDGLRLAFMHDAYGRVA